MQIRINTEHELASVAEQVVRFAGNRRVFLVNGEMGAGKTTLIKAICRHLGSSDHFGSPTFSIVNEYRSPNGPLYHLDLYRIKEVKELDELGFGEYIDSGNYCFIEWPQIGAAYYPGNIVPVVIEAEATFRIVSVED